MQRRTTRTVQVGSVAIGSGHPIAVQSMLCAAPGDIDGNIAQAMALKEAGCDIVRLAIPTMEDIRLISAIKKEVELPLVADIHFNYRLALLAGWPSPQPRQGSIKYASTPAISAGGIASGRWQTPAGNGISPFGSG